jgi:hypothetical protein
MAQGHISLSQRNLNLNNKIWNAFKLDLKRNRNKRRKQIRKNSCSAWADFDCRPSNPAWLLYRYLCAPAQLARSPQGMPRAPRHIHGGPARQQVSSSPADDHELSWGSWWTGFSDFGWIFPYPAYKTWCRPSWPTIEATYLHFVAT